MLSFKQKYESEIRTGLLAILFVLVFLNFISLFVIHRARTAKLEEVSRAFQTAAVSVSRAVQEVYPRALSDEEMETLREHYSLDGLYFVSSRPTDESPEVRRKWFASVAATLPQDKIVDLASKLINTDFQAPTRAQADEYFYLYPVPGGAGRSLLIVSKRLSGLAYLDQAGKTILGVGLIGVFLVSLVFLVLAKVIYAPFRKIGRQATRAGRLEIGQEGDVAEVVADYEKMVTELTASQAELKQLHAEATERADSLAQFNQYLQRAIDSGLVTISPDGAVRSVNRAGRRILNLAELTEQATFDSIFAQVPELNATISDVLKGGDLPEYREYTVRDQTSNVQNIGVTISGIRDSHEHRIGLAVLFNDLSELNELRRQLESQKRLVALGEMAGGLAHQLRNAMGVISGYARLVGKRLEAIEESSDTVAALLQEVQDSEQLVRQFLTFTRPLTPEPTPTSIKTLLAEVVDSFRVRPDIAPVQFRMDSRADQVLSIDPLLMKQVFVNLIENGINAAEGMPVIIGIATSVSSDGFAIEVSDTGCGIEPDDLERIFTPFYSSRPAGTGLGLSLVRKIVDLHGGRISVRSTPGAGTTITVHLPMTLRAPAVTQAAIIPVH
jgi:signal transduction histidine kinase